MNDPLYAGDLPAVFHSLHDVQVLRLLLAAGADPNAAAEDGFTPYMLATVSPLFAR